MKLLLEDLDIVVSSYHCHLNSWKNIVSTRYFISVCKSHLLHVTVQSEILSQIQKLYGQITLCLIFSNKNQMFYLLLCKLNECMKHIFSSCDHLELLANVSQWLDVQMCINCIYYVVYILKKYLLALYFINSSSLTSFFLLILTFFY